VISAARSLNRLGSYPYDGASFDGILRDSVIFDLHLGSSVRTVLVSRITHAMISLFDKWHMSFGYEIIF
jgi:hypothetical protein